MVSKLGETIAAVAPLRLFIKNGLIFKEEESYYKNGILNFVFRFSQLSEIEEFS